MIMLEKVRGDASVISFNYDISYTFPTCFAALFKNLMPSGVITLPLLGFSTFLI